MSRAAGIGAAGLALALLPAALPAADVTLELPLGMLNELVARLGAFSDTGTHTPQIVEHDPDAELCIPMGVLDCPEVRGGFPGLEGEVGLVQCITEAGERRVLAVGEPVVYQWWINNAAYVVVDGALRFRASVLSKVNGVWRPPVDVEVGAEIGLEGQTLYVDPEPVSVPITYTFQDVPQTAHVVAVDRPHRLGVPVVSGGLTAQGIFGATRASLTASVSLAGEPQYFANRIVVRFDVDFE